MKNARSVPLLRSPVDRAVTAIVTARLDAAVRAAERVANAEDTEALHDFRVGIRRLRSALKAYRPWLGKASSRNLRDRFRDLARSTNEDRDIEVEIEWIRKCRRQAPAAVREELSRYLRHVGRHRQSRRKLVETFGRMESKLRRRLERIEPNDARFSELYAVLVADHVKRTAGCLAAIRGAGDVVRTHRARIAAKNLRYLLEPVAAEHPRLRARVKSLAELQDVLGELHDAHVFADRWKRSSAGGLNDEGTKFLLARNSARRDDLFACLRRRWPEGGMDGTWADVRGLSALA